MPAGRIINSTGKRPVLFKTGNGPTDKNFEELQRHVIEMWPGVWAHEISVDLLPGDNKIKPPISKPRGHVFTYRSSPSTVYDKGLDANGFWTLTASESITLHIAWF